MTGHREELADASTGRPRIMSLLWSVMATVPCHARADDGQPGPTTRLILPAAHAVSCDHGSPGDAARRGAQLPVPTYSASPPMTLICIICRSSQTAIGLRLPRMRVRRRGAIECRVDTPAIPRRTLSRMAHAIAKRREIFADEKLQGVLDEI